MNDAARVGNSSLDGDKIVSLEDYVEAFSVYSNILKENEKGNKSNEPGIQEKIESTRKKFEAVSSSFRKEHGEILNRYICTTTDTAALICQKKRKNIFSSDTIKFFSLYELGVHPEIESLLIEIDFLAAESSRLLRGKNLNRCLGIIYKVSKNTLGILDALNHKHLKAVKDDENISKTVEVIKHNLAHARKYHERAAKFTAQLDYFSGNIYAFLGLLLLLFSFSFVEGISIEKIYGLLKAKEVGLLIPLYVGLMAGSIGAIISVMNRLSSGDLQLNYEPDARTITTIGIIRPLIGGFFGAIILILFNSGLSIFSLLEGSESKVLANFIILAFIAGFFERFVPDILDQTKEKILNNEIAPK